MGAHPRRSEPSCAAPRSNVPKVLGAAAAFVLVAACSSGHPTAVPTPSGVPTSATSATSSAPAPTRTSPTPSPTPSACPATYAPPDPHRPVVRITADIAADGTSVSGQEHIVFTPDRPIQEVVLRLWANGPRARAAGARQGVPTATVSFPEHELVHSVHTDGSADSRGTTYEVPLEATVAAGTEVTVDLGWQLVLPQGANERFGHRNGVAWFGSGVPMLAWERGLGWATEPATSAFAEASTSEAYRLADLAVTTRASDTVLATGTPGGVDQVGGGRVRRHFSAVSVRDVLVAAGPMTLTQTTAAGVPITVGVTPGLPDSGPHIADRVAAAVRHHSALLGPFPFSRLVVPVVPDVHGGIEYPGGFLLGTKQADDATPSHETAHEWFYGLVGDNQARNPWLDESFATYVEALHRGTGARYERLAIPASGRGRVGAPMTYWETHQSAYFRSVYIQGAAALLRARRAVGAQRFDAAIRCYVNATAHRIARPGDLAAALTALPAALRELRRVGAL